MSATPIILRLSALVVLTLAARTAGAGDPAVTCGTVLAPGTEATLTADLSCDGPGVTVESATLHLNGHSISCQDDLAGNVGLTVTGTRSLIEGPGNVSGCGPNVVVGGEGKHTVTDVHISGAGDSHGLIIHSDKNKIVSSSSSNNDYNGIVVGGSKNQIIDAAVAANGEDGISVGGTKNAIVGSTINNNATGIRVGGSKSRLADNVVGGNSYGIELFGADNKVQGNSVTGSSYTGISVTQAAKVLKNVVTGNGSDPGDNGINVAAAADAKVKIVKNQATGNGPTDLHDDDADCGAHKWKKNDFGSADPDCIE